MPVASTLLLAALVASLGPVRQDASDAAPAVVGSVFSYTVAPGDSLTLVSARFGVELPALARLSGLAPDARLKIGQVLTVDNRHIVPRPNLPVVLNIPQRMLFVQVTDAVLHAYPVAVGRPTWRTPLGDFTVLAKETDPTWDVPPSIQEEARRAGRQVPVKVPPGPDNPLGKYWLALSLSGIGIHGTNEPASIFGFTTHGCIRVGPPDIEVAFQEIPVGAIGKVIYQPVLLTVSGGRVMVEVHRDIYRRISDGLEVLRVEADRLGVANRIDSDKLEQSWRDAAGTVVDVTK